MTTLQFEPHPEGVVVTVDVHAGARRNEVRLDEKGVFKVAVTQVPEKGKANRAVLERLADFLDVRKSQLELLAGETSRHKKILLRGENAEELSRRIVPAGSE